MAFIELRDISKSVRAADDSELHILRGVNLRIEEGEHLSIVGRSGSGKSTLLNILGLLDAPTSGELLFDGKPTAALRLRARDRMRGAQIGFVFQQFNLLEGRTATENVAMPLLYARDRSFWRRDALAREALTDVGLDHRLDSLPTRLSGGEQQRVAIARAIVRRPRVILADEPTGALDVETGARVMTLLADISKETGAALVTITHDENVAARADRMLRLDAGVLVPSSAGRGTDAATDPGTGLHSDRSTATDLQLDLELDVDSPAPATATATRARTTEATPAEGGSA
ncbi:putative ABC transport system ATP-binding protein [Pseudoclavibacter sp. JAI123]|uniref:ABC transporter ATP-binding protein n=1 Tax=Pseudoclavibacter sp. JAI123 TaxID=2723065 RepID=UPI0015C89612|nr:ABC transporter ATP-binding protein [Pseudoclavibacter sp. JAI123]NYF14749.1 putative ABC transport system ATP-binding protein [Pseudoclavibacter sp. JAI123]